jgi:hypothetical protein
MDETASSIAFSFSGPTGIAFLSSPRSAGPYLAGAPDSGTVTHLNEWILNGWSPVKVPVELLLRAVPWVLLGRPATPEPGGFHMKMLSRLATAAALVVAAPVPAADLAKDPVAEAGAAYAALEKADVEALSAELDLLVADPALVGPFVARDRAKLLAAARPRFAKLEKERMITHWYFIEPEPSRTCFLRVHAPDQLGDRIDRETLSRAIASQKIGAGKELGKTAFALRVVKPIRAKGKVVGYMELGEEIGHFLTRMKAQTGDDYAVLADKARLDRAALVAVRKEDRWDERPDVVLVDSTVWNEATVSLGAPLAKLPPEGTRLPEWKDGQGRYIGGAFPIRDAADQVVGALFVRRAVR